MTKKTWHPADLQQVFPQIPESISRSVMAAARSVKEENDMKARHTIRLTLALALTILCLTGIALAVTSPRISSIFGDHFGEDFKAWLEEGDVALPENSITVDGVTFTLNEVAHRNRGLYALGTITPGEGMLLLATDYTVSEPYGYAVFQGDKAPEGTPSLLETAAAQGKTIKQVAYYLEKIGADDGALVEPSGWGCDDRPQRDGSIQFVFEVEDGVAIPADAETYTILLTAIVRNVSESGEADYDNAVRKEWRVEIAPRPFAEVMEATPAAAPENTVDLLPSAAHPGEMILPDAYAKTGTLPVYQAIPRSFRGKLDYAWFNQSGVKKAEEFTRHIGGAVDYADGGHLEWAEQSIHYTVYDGTYEAVSEVFEGRTVKTITEILPKDAMAAQAGSIAGWMALGFPGTDQVYTLEKETLTHITLEEAKATAEELLGKLGLEGYTCTTALDMDKDRIVKMGNALNYQMDIGNLGGNAFRYDYSQVSLQDEGYYLEYHKFGKDGDLAGLFRATFYITADGIQVIHLNDQYAQGPVLRTPERLLDAAVICEGLPEEMAKSHNSDKLVEIRRATLTWMPLRDTQGSGMILSPVWMLTYVTDEGQQQGYTDWAAFDAVNGKLADAIFN